jgi:hypothetical protein
VLGARQLGIAEIPVMVDAGGSEAQKRAYVRRFKISRVVEPNLARCGISICAGALPIGGPRAAPHLRRQVEGSNIA